MKTLKHVYVICLIKFILPFINYTSIIYKKREVRKLRVSYWLGGFQFLSQWALTYDVKKIAAAAAAKVLQSCPTVQPHRWQPTRLPRPWDSPGKNTGVGCHVLLQCMKVKSESEVAQSCPTPRDPMDCSLPGSSIPGILQARTLEWVAIAFSKKR